MVCVKKNSSWIKRYITMDSDAVFDGDYHFGVSTLGVTEKSDRYSKIFCECLPNLR